MEKIIATFIEQKSQRHPITRQPISKEKRMNTMYSIVTNNGYYVEYSKAERILAAEFIKQILEED